MDRICKTTRASRADEEWGLRVCGDVSEFLRRFLIAGALVVALAVGQWACAPKPSQAAVRPSGPQAH